MRPHVGARKLARYRQGDLGPRRSSRIGAHLARCARCRTLNEDLAGVTTLLASVHPPPIPDHLEARIHTALATEAARRVTLPAESARPRAAAAAAPGTGRNRARRERAAPAARTARARPAAAPGPPWPRDRAARPGRGRRGGARGRGHLRDRPGLGLLLVVGRELAGRARGAGGGGQARHAAGTPAFGPGCRTGSGGQDSITPVMTGTDFTPGNLGGQVAAQLARYGRGAALAGPNAMTPAATRSPATAGGQPATFGHMAVSDLAGCVNRIAAGDLVLLVDVARYRGGPATVIVTKGPAGGPEQIWVVGPGCSASRSDVLKHAALSAVG